MSLEQKILEDGRCEVALEGELTIYAARDLQAELLACLDAHPALTLDLGAVTEVDTAGVQILLLLKREARTTGKPLAFVSHSPAVLEVMDLYNLNGVFGDPVVIREQSSQPEEARP
jgi:anti-anti-sigma factor